MFRLRQIKELGNKFINKGAEKDALKVKCKDLTPGIPI